MSEVRRTADSATTRVGGQAWPEQRALPEQGRMGWLETECPEVHVQQPRRPAGDADAGFPRPGRSQSVHSSEEASNDRGAKGHRKLVGAMTVEGHTAIQHSAQKAVRAGAAKAAGNRVALRGAAETRMQRKRHGPDGAVKRLPRLGQPISFGPATGKPDARNGPVRFGGRGEVQTLVPTPIQRKVMQFVKNALLCRLVHPCAPKKGPRRVRRRGRRRRSPAFFGRPFCPAIARRRWKHRRRRAGLCARPGRRFAASIPRRERSACRSSWL